MENIEYEMSLSEFKKLSARDQKVYRKEHDAFVRYWQIVDAREKRQVAAWKIEDQKERAKKAEIKSTKKTDNELERQNAYAMLADIGVPFNADGELAGIWSD